ncbi:TetR/AcrR family transcriptional regulator [Sinomicrobium pectinilyticum]|uniref:TetR/AcrR family transcriptional regulator n=1 Tax=Sinomicrobium pectinilyticum TaxID=1084421 RepID=A0A3N0DYQ4_SINP1|nr:TetR/AcrR family transcriptional regulator [Sinomicrobium pectinilyticum]RNL80738.1 TetR/AcrR family transcriptional regulator [Sinomicrobium pectinilyticum]
MESILGNLRMRINEKLYLKDPETSVLGKKILEHSILLIDKMGFESFTFKKLGKSIGSNESSVYRYFENKHKLLLYLSSWYWSWVEYRMALATLNIDPPLKRLHIAIRELTGEVEDDDRIAFIRESVLNRIIIAEFTKTFLTKEVDEENRQGFFLVYKSVINRLAALIADVNPDYPYIKSLASSIVEGALHQHYLKDHFTTITDFYKKENDITAFYIENINKILL